MAPDHTATALAGMSEAHAMGSVLAEADPSARTACAGWTVHEITAHLAAGSTEIADLIEARLAGRHDRATRGFEEREAPLRALSHDALLGRLAVGIQRKLSAYDALRELDDPSIRFTGTSLTVDELEMHSRSEAAIHRWDIVGDDDVASVHLAQPELTAHTVKVLDAMRVLNESARSIALRSHATAGPIRVVFRSDGCADVVFVAADGQGHFELSDTRPVDGDVTVTSDPAQRLLALWGRRSAARPITMSGDVAIIESLGSALWPHARPSPPKG
jgi:hypothetical protein